MTSLLKKTFFAGSYEYKQIIGHKLTLALYHIHTNADRHELTTANNNRNSIIGTCALLPTRPFAEGTAAARVPKAVFGHTTRRLCRATEASQLECSPATGALAATQIGAKQLNP